MRKRKWLLVLIGVALLPFAVLQAWILWEVSYFLFLLPWKVDRELRNFYELVQLHMTQEQVLEAFKQQEYSWLAMQIVLPPDRVRDSTYFRYRLDGTKIRVDMENDARDVKAIAHGPMFYTDGNEWAIVIEFQDGVVASVRARGESSLDWHDERMPPDKVDPALTRWQGETYSEVVADG